MRLTMKKMMLLPILLLFGTGCSSSNVSSDWECPHKRGYKCVTIREADWQYLKPNGETGYRNSGVKKCEKDGEIVYLIGGR